MVTTLPTSLAQAIDPVRLSLRAGIVPDAWQAELLRSSARQSILCCARQSGKSTTAATMATHQAVYVPDSLVLVLSPSLRQSVELYRKILDTYNALGADVPKPDEESSLRLELANGSRIVSLPAKESTIRGFSGAALLLVDEAARVDDAIYGAVRPMLAVSQGRIVLMSTPFGRRGFFHREWTEGGADWHRVRVPAAECSRIPADWLAAERRRIPSWFAQQEYDCEFVDDQDQMIATDVVRAALDRTILPLEVTLP